MANLEDDWPGDYKRKIEEIETKLNREICGAPDADGEPCQKWPVDSEHGRCREHHNTTTSASPEATTANQNSVEEVGEERSPTTVGNYFTWPYFLILTCCGLFLGLGLVLGWYYFKPVAFAGKTFFLSENTQLSNETKEKLEVNPDDPDFMRLREQARQGKVDQVVASLQKIAARTEKKKVRAEANYQLFVFYQRQEEFERALEIADKFLGNFTGTRRAAEILYGAGYICERFLEEPGRAQEYYDSLQEKYPDSKWAEQVS